MNSAQFILDAKLIHSNNPRVDHSIASVQFAVEEVGKASKLREKLQESPEDIIDVSDNLFGGRGSHQLKEREGWTVLTNCRRIIAEEAFDPKDFNHRDFVTEYVELSHEERLRSLFVDYKEERVRLGAAFESEKLEELISCIEKEIERLKASWIPTLK